MKYWKTSMETFLLRHEQNDFYTHQPVLIQALKISTGDVLELGCGEGSTELIHRYCAKHNRNVVTVEDDSEWISRYRDRFTTDNHKFVHTNNWVESLDLFSKTHWGLVFIDQQGWHNRVSSFRIMRDNADYIILHDCDYFPENGLMGFVVKPYSLSPYSVGERNWSDEIKYYKEFHPNKPLCWTGTKLTGPPTLLASNRHPCNISVDFSVTEETF